uniref:F-box domain-containing protein n=1 Tax=Mycena chlorophos TaxID=658473 RepID=A0ABQ0KY89_MYCCL|nr:predicted protein [Mycena chlorophos]
MKSFLSWTTMHVLRKLQTAMPFRKRSPSSPATRKARVDAALPAPRTASEVLPSIFAELPRDLVRLILETSAWSSIYFHRHELTDLLVLSQDVHAWISWIAYDTVILNQTQVPKFISFAQTREHLSARIRVLALTGGKLPASVVSRLEELLRSRLHGLESLHYSCVLSPFIAMGHSLQHSLQLPMVPSLRFLSVPWRLLAAQDTRNIVQLASGDLTHLHLHLEATDLGSQNARLRITLAKFASVTHLTLNRYTDELLQWLETEMPHLQRIVAFTTVLPFPPSTSAKLTMFHTSTHIDAFSAWFNREIGSNDYFA